MRYTRVTVFGDCSLWLNHRWNPEVEYPDPDPWGENLAHLNNLNADELNKTVWYLFTAEGVKLIITKIRLMTMSYSSNVLI